MNIQKAIVEWGIETANFYDSMARTEAEFDRAFYTQSDLRKVKTSPELMILGINPGSEGSYQEQIENENWKKWGMCGCMDGVTFLKGNPMLAVDGTSHPEDIEKWYLWKRLRTILSFGDMENILNDSSRYIYTNIVCFNTKKAKEVSSIFKRCIPYTLKLIRITQPKMVLCLGSDCFKHLCDAAEVDMEVLIQNEISRAWIDETLVVHIPHTSKYYSHEEMALVGRSLQLLSGVPNMEFAEFSLQIKEKLDAFKQRIPAQTVSKQIGIEIEKICCDRFKDRNFDSNHPWYSLPCNLMLCISHSSNGIVGIRHREFRTNNSCSEELQKLLNYYEFSVPDNKAWFGVRSFKSYDGNKTSESSGGTVKVISRNIIAAIDQLIIDLEKGV